MRQAQAHVETVQSSMETNEKKPLCSLTAFGSFRGNSEKHIFQSKMFPDPDTPCWHIKMWTQIYHMPYDLPIPVTKSLPESNTLGCQILAQWKPPTSTTP